MLPALRPGSQGWRLAGLTLAVLLLAAAELVVWPDPTPEPYTAKLGTAVDALAGCLDAVADSWSGRADRAGWLEALFTVVIALVFAQVAPADWHLAEARVVDVAVGAAIGVAAGLLAWPRGGSGELHRSVGTFLGAAARLVRETVDVPARGAPRGDALPWARAAGELAQASWALHQSERHPAAMVDWQATLAAGHHAVRGAEALLRECPTGRLLPCVGPLSTVAADVGDRYARAADAVAGDDSAALTAPPPPEPRVEWPTDLGPALYHLADLRVWLDGLREDLGRLTGPPEPADLRQRVTHLTEG